VNVSDNIAGDSPYARLATALDRFVRDDDTSLLGEAAHGVFVAEGFDLADMAREQPDVPTEFLERLVYAQASFDSDWKISTAMLSSIVRERSFEIQPPKFRAQIWESLAGARRKQYETTKSAQAIDQTVDAFQRAADAADPTGNPRLKIYLYSLGTCLVTRGIVRSDRDDFSRGRVAIRRALDLCASDKRMKMICLVALEELGKLGTRDDDLVAILETLQLASRDAALDPQTQNEIRLKLSKLALERTLAARSLQLIDRVESILLAASENLPNLDPYNQVLLDNIARMRGWRESIGALAESDQARPPPDRSAERTSAAF
jgi:hypothetical protein